MAGGGNMSRAPLATKHRPLVKPLVFSQLDHRKRLDTGKRCNISFSAIFLHMYDWRAAFPLVARYRNASIDVPPKSGNDRHVDADSAMGVCEPPGARLAVALDRNLLGRYVQPEILAGVWLGVVTLTACGNGHLCGSGASLLCTS